LTWPASARRGGKCRFQTVFLRHQADFRGRRDNLNRADVLRQLGTGAGGVQRGQGVLEPAMTLRTRSPSLARMGSALRIAGRATSRASCCSAA